MQRKINPSLPIFPKPVWNLIINHLNLSELKKFRLLNKAFYQFTSQSDIWFFLCMTNYLNNRIKLIDRLTKIDETQLMSLDILNDYKAILQKIRNRKIIPPDKWNVFEKMIDYKIQQLPNYNPFQNEKFKDLLFINFIILLFGMIFYGVGSYSRCYSILFKSSPCLTPFYERNFTINKNKMMSHIKRMFHEIDIREATKGLAISNQTARTYITILKNTTSKTQDFGFILMLLAMLMAIYLLIKTVLNCRAISTVKNNSGLPYSQLFFHKNRNKIIELDDNNDKEKEEMEILTYPDRRGNGRCTIL